MPLNLLSWFSQPILAEYESVKLISSVVIAAVVLVPLINGVLGMRKNLKPMHPDPRDLQTFVTKADHQALTKRVDTIERDTNFQTHATQRALGRIESSLEHLEKQQSTTKQD